MEKRGKGICCVKEENGCIWERLTTPLKHSLPSVPSSMKGSQQIIQAPYFTKYEFYFQIFFYLQNCIAVLVWCITIPIHSKIYIYQKYLD